MSWALVKGKRFLPLKSHEKGEILFLKRKLNLCVFLLQQCLAMFPWEVSSFGVWIMACMILQLLCVIESDNCLLIIPLFSLSDSISISKWEHCTSSSKIFAKAPAAMEDHVTAVITTRGAPEIKGCLGLL